jgi:ribosome-associated protein
MTDAPDTSRPASRRGVIATDEQALELGKGLVDVLSDRQAADIILLDLRSLTPVTDFFIIATGETGRQVNALREYSERFFLEAGIRQLHNEGSGDSGWILLDYGAIIVHLFDPAQRGFYQLERVWEKAPAVLRIQ